MTQLFFSGPPIRPLWSSRRAGVLLALALLAAVPLSRAGATTIIEKDFSSICAEADLIFAGVVRKVESRWRDQARRSIETVVTFTVEERVHGVSGSEVELAFAGGEMDGLREVVAGIPEFRVGEQVVVFASSQPSISPVIGFNQGYFRVEGGRVLNAERAPVLGARQRALTVGDSSQTERGMPLSEFLAAVRQRLAESER